MTTYSLLIRNHLTVVQIIWNTDRHDVMRTRHEEGEVELGCQFIHSTDNTTHRFKVCPISFISTDTPITD